MIWVVVIKFLMVLFVLVSSFVRAVAAFPPGFHASVAKAPLVYNLFRALMLICQLSPKTFQVEISLGSKC